MNPDVKEKDIKTYREVFDVEDYKERSKQAQKATDSFYTLITKFYEKGWGNSFHFAPRRKGQSFEDSILKHEYYLTEKLGILESDKVLDVGCGVMGPARTIARATGAHITGLTINRYQVERSNELNAQSDVADLLDVVEGDFMDMPFPENSFDKMYAIEALCHAPSLDGVYRQIYDHLKPGGKAAFYQWGMTDKFDPANPEHLEVKKQIEYGNSITRLKTLKEIDQALEKSPLKVLETKDLLTDEYENSIPWYATLKAGWSLKQFRQTKVSRTIMKYFLRSMESLGVFPKGISETQRVLLIAADSLVKGGEMGIFTPMYFILVEP